MNEVATRRVIRLMACVQQNLLIVEVAKETFKIKRLIQLDQLIMVEVSHLMGL